MQNDKGEDIDVARNAEMTVKIKLDEIAKEGSMLRKRREEI